MKDKKKFNVIKVMLLFILSFVIGYFVFVFIKI